MKLLYLSFGRAFTMIDFMHLQQENVLFIKCTFIKSYNDKDSKSMLETA